MYEIRKDGALLALTEQVNYIRLHRTAFTCCARRRRPRAWR